MLASLEAGPTTFVMAKPAVAHSRFYPLDPHLALPLSWRAAVT